MSASGSYFATAGDDIKIWDSTSLQIVKQYNYHKGNVKDLAWNRDNSIICSTSASGDKLLLAGIQLNQVDKPKIIAEHAVDENQTCVRISHSGRKMYSGGMGGDVNVWDRETGQLKKAFKDTHSSPVTCIALNETETHVVSGSNKGDVVIRNLSSNTTSKPHFKSEGHAVRSMIFSPWSHSLVGMAMDDGTLHLHDTLQSTTYHSFHEIHKAPAMSIAFSNFNELLFASVGLDKKLIIYDVNRKKSLNKASLEQPLTSVGFLLDGVTLIAGTSLGQIYQLDLRSMSKPINESLAHSTSVQRIAVQNPLKMRKDRYGGKRRAESEKRRPNVDSEDNLVKTRSNQNQTYMAGLHDRVSQRSLASSSGKSSSENSHPEITLPSFSSSAGKPPLIESTPLPTITAPHTMHLHAGDYSGVISPVRDDVFGGFNESTPTNHGGFSFSTTTSSMGSFTDVKTSVLSTSSMGSFTDDIVSPVASHSKKIQHGMAGKQTNTRTSPHPLRQTNTPAVNPQSFHLESRLKPPKGQPNLDKNQDQLETPPSITLRATHSGTAVNGDDMRSARSETPKEVHEQHKPTLAENTPVTSEQASSFKPDAAAFQYQATYLRNSVKELVDELGDDIRSQVNEVFTEMVKLFLFQEDLIRELLMQRRCGINEQLLDELERLKQENEKLRRT